MKYNFPDEESFRVQIVTETGWSWFQGQKITQTFDLNGVNDHDCPMSTGRKLRLVTSNNEKI